MHTLDNLVFRKQKTVWMDWHSLLWESWKALRERRQQIWFKDMVEKLPTQWARKRVISSWDGILGRVNFPRYIVMYSSKEDKKKNCEHKHVSCTFSPNFYNKSGCGLQLNTWETCHKFALINTIHWQYVTLQSTLTRTEKFTMVEIYHFLFVVGF